MPGGGGGSVSEVLSPDCDDELGELVELPELPLFELFEEPPDDELEPPLVFALLPPLVPLLPLVDEPLVPLEPLELELVWPSCCTDVEELPRELDPPNDEFDEPLEPVAALPPDVLPPAAPTAEAIASVLPFIAAAAVAITLSWLVSTVVC